MAAIAANWASPRRRSLRGLHASEDVHIVAVDLDAKPGYERLLSEDERERAANFRFERDRRRFVAGRSILRQKLAQYLDAAPAELVFVYGPHGKPTLPGSDVSFNVSNSGRAGLFAFASGFELGVDVELLAHARPNDDAVAARFFSAAEVAVLQACPTSTRAHAFLRCWTRKEAYLKARGSGLAAPLDQFDVTLRAGEPALLLADRSHAGEAMWHLTHLDRAHALRRE